VATSTAYPVTLTSPRHGNGVFEKLPLYGSSTIPLQKHRRAKGTARHAPLPPREARFCRGSVPMLIQAHLLRVPIWQGRWPADRSPYVSLVSWRPWDAEESAATGNGAPSRPRQSDVAGAQRAPNSKSNLSPSFFFEILSF
jgi:hypothetical protein